jgi:thioredoxin-related protein
MKKILLLMSILAWALAAPASLAAGFTEVPHTQNLRLDARQGAAHDAPLLILFASPGCHYCAKVKSDYLIPMLNDPAYKNKVVIREVEAGSGKSLTGFDSSKLTEGELAADYNVHVTPTIMFLDAKGHKVAKDIIGLLIPDYYQAYLDAGIEQGADNIRAGRTIGNAE